MHKIVLATINAKWIHPSLALRLLKANLGALEGSATILEFALRQPMAEKRDGILQARPAILGLSVSIWNHAQTLELLRELSREWARAGTRPLVVLGGPEASNLNDDAELLRYCDCLIRGEGEDAFRELCSRELELGWPRAEPLPARPQIIDAALPDLSAIQTAYQLYTDEDLSRKLVYVEASRGCPFGCEFCLSSLDRRVREFPLGPFLSDMDALIRRGARSFKFLDRTFNLDLARAQAILEFFLARLVPGLYVHFEMVPTRIGPELRPLLARFPAGSLRLEVGIQTLNTEVAKRIGRSSDPERELEALSWLSRETNAIVHADLIAGLPGETLESFACGFDRLWRTRPGEIQLGVLKCLPGTPIARHSESFGMRYSETAPYEVLETNAVPRAEMDRIKNAARFWELLVNREHFPEQIARLLPDDLGGTVFWRFIACADWLLARFRKNWGLDRAQVRAALEEYLDLQSGAVQP